MDPTFADRSAGNIDLIQAATLRAQNEMSLRVRA
jgi:hypothetical protein